MDVNDKDGPIVITEEMRQAFWPVCEHNFVTIPNVPSGKECTLCGFAYYGTMIAEAPEMTANDLLFAAARRCL